MSAVASAGEDSQVDLRDLPSDAGLLASSKVVAVVGVVVVGAAADIGVAEVEENVDHSFVTKPMHLVSPSEC